MLYFSLVSEIFFLDNVVICDLLLMFNGLMVRFNWVIGVFVIFWFKVVMCVSSLLKLNGLYK